MKIVDLNVVIYSHNEASPHHERLMPWWQSALNGDESIGLAWTVILGFLRITTNPKIFPNPLTAEDASVLIDSWLAAPSVAIVTEKADHWTMVRSLISQSGAAGNLTTDAHLAALALTHGATLVSCDSDFARFEGLRWENPLRRQV